MARFSPRAMNNVVIFTMLLMIALFNLDSFLPTPDTRQPLDVLSDDDYVLRIEHQGNSLERAGQQWRQKTSSSLRLPISPAEQLEAWRQAILTPAEKPKDVAPDDAQVVVIWLAGQSQGRVLAFYPLGNKQVAVKFNGQWYALSGASVADLLPWWQVRSD